MAIHIFVKYAETKQIMNIEKHIKETPDQKPYVKYAAKNLDIKSYIMMIKVNMIIVHLVI